MWERTLQDLVRGLRANKKDEAKFIAKAVDEIRQEIKSDDMELKAGAVLKLTYLDMLGYDMSWASFHVVEVMSSSKVHLKTIGYLAAAQSFEQDTDVLMLTTNLLKKDLNSMPADVAITLDGLSHIVTPELARDLSPELIAMLNHSRAHIKKRAILAIYKLLIKHPEAISQARVRLEEKLSDSDPAVVAAAVNVFCELARRNPKDCLSLAPQLFHLLTSSSNNWMLIKIIKLFGSLSPHEPRLVKKLQAPITELISTTPAISLLYECVHTCIIGGMLQGSSGDSLAKMCVSKLAAFIQDADQNLKYIALLAMVKIVPSHPHLVADYQDTILASVNDQDISIRMRALDLVTTMVNRSNLQSIVQQLLAHLVRDPSSSLPTAAQSLVQNTSGVSSNTVKAFVSPTQSPAYRLVLSKSILNMCSQSTYENVTNFEWYLSVLVDLSHVANVDVGSEIRDQLVDVVGRVRASRPYAVKLMYTLISDDAMLRNASVEGNCSEIFWAAAWICGEYCQELAEPQKLIPYLLQPEVSNLPPDVIAVYIQATTKIFGFWASELGQRWSDDELPGLKRAVMSIQNRVGEFASCLDIEVQERAANTLQLFNFISADINSFLPNMRVVSSSPLPGSSSQLDGPPSRSDELRFPKSLYLIQPLVTPYELNPVATTAQASVVPPEGLNLDTWFIEPPSEVTYVQADDADVVKTKKTKKGKAKDLVSNANLSGKKTLKNGDVALINTIEADLETPEEIAQREKRKAERLAQLRDDPYYIIDDRPSKAIDVDSIPVVHLEDMPPIIDEWKSKLPSLRATSHTFYSEAFVVEREGEMPDGTVAQRPHPFSHSTNNLAPNSSIGDPSTSSFPSYQLSGHPSSNSSAAPEPIKVVRPKKKATGKKKQTVVAANAPSL